MSITLTDPTGVTEDIVVEKSTPEYDDNAPGDNQTHIVNPPLNQHIWHPGMTMQEVVDTARNMGLEVTALCGYTWIPRRNPEKYPACPECMKIAGELMRGAGE